MVGEVIDTTGMDSNTVFSLVAGSRPNDDTINYLRNERSTFITDVGSYRSDFIDDISRIHESRLENDYLAKANRLIARTAGLVGDDRIQCIDMNSIHTTTSKMKEYVMSLPKVYELYGNNRCSGYDDVWFNNEPTTKPEFRDNYLKVIDGMVDDDGIVSTVIFDEDVSELTLTEKLCVRDAWDTALNLMASGIDPTSPTKDKL